MQTKKMNLRRVSFKKSWIIWGVAALFYCYQFMLRVSPNVMGEDLMVAFQVDACTLGILVGCYYNTYSILQIPGGTLMDYFKPRRVLTFAAIICGVGALLFSMSNSIYVAGLGRTLIGAGSAMGFLSCLKIGTLWFPARKLSLIIGLTVFLGTLGGVSAGYPLAWLVDIYGWRHAMWLVAFIGFGLAVLAWLLVRDTPPDALEKEVLKSHGDTDVHLPKVGLLTSLIAVVRKPQSWLIAIYGGLTYLPIACFPELWGTFYLMSAYQVDKLTAGTISTVLLLGLGLGSPIFPFLCNFLKSYKATVFISAFGSLVFFSIILYVPGIPLWLFVGGLFFAGFFLSGQFLAFSMTCALNPLSASATAGGFHNMICMMLSGMIFSPFIGWLLKNYTWQGQMANGIAVHTTAEYTFALSLITIALFLGCCIIFFIEEKYPRD